MTYQPTFDLIEVCIPLKEKFSISGGSAETKSNVLAVMDNRYVGEAAASVKYGPGVDVLLSELQRGIEMLQASLPISKETLATIRGFQIHPIARSTLTGMVLNYLSGSSNRYPWEVLGLPTPVGIRSSMTAAINDASSVIEAIRNSPHSIVKVKLGSPDDLPVIEQLRQLSGRDIRIDANGGWSLEQAEEMIYYLIKAGIKVIEQPTTPENVKEWPHLKQKDATLELVMDEGLGTLEDYEAVKDQVDGVNIKMAKSGGVMEAIAIAQAAKRDGKKIMLGCMVESSFGIAPAVYVSSLADYWDLDGPMLLEEDLATGLTFDHEQIRVDREIIGGPRLRRAIIERYAS
jgi:L-alanine-DL-glutamate epimerase-like enolase superfamily enzyme